MIFLDVGGYMIYYGNPVEAVDYFKNEDAQMMIDYYKGFVMPMLFFPALSWMTFKPLFIKP